MTDLDEWRQTHAVAVNYECICGGPVRHYDDQGNTTKLKCGLCGEIGTVTKGRIRTKLDGLRRI